MANTNDSIYGVAQDEAWELFGDFLDGSHAATVLVVSSGALPEVARHALESSFAALGWGTGACTFLAWPDGLEDGGALMTAIEGLDPCALVIADQGVVRLLEAAYRQRIVFRAAFRLQCRECCAFESFAQMMDSETGKQRAWAALKTLPKRG